MAKIYSPFTVEQVESLNGWQILQSFHPFTCRVDSGHAALVARQEGWYCLDCGYTQDWAHDFMADDSWRQWSTAKRLTDLAD